MVTASAVPEACGRPGPGFLLPEGLPGPPVQVFVDGGYILSLITSRNHTTPNSCVVDAARLVEVIGKTVEHQFRGRLGGRAVAMRWYDAVDPTRRVATPWVKAISHIADVTVRLGRVSTFEGGRMRQKRVDTLLVADMVELAHASHQPADIVLITGDDDLTPGVQAARRRGIRTHLCTVTDRGARLGVSRHLVDAVDEVFSIDVAGLAVLVRSRSRLFAQMAGLTPATEPDAGVKAQDPEGTQPMLPGLEEASGIPDSDADVAASVGNGTAPGKVTRAYLAGRAYAHRWWLRTDPVDRAGLVAEALRSWPFVPHEIDDGLMRFAASHVSVRSSNDNRMDVRAGFNHALIDLAKTGPGGLS